MTQTAQITANGAPNGAPHAPVAPFAPCPPMKSGGHGGSHARPRAPMPRASAPNGAPDGAVYGASGGAYDAALVIARLEEAGTTLLALPSSGPSTRMRTSALDIVRNAADAYGWDTTTRLRPSAPSATHITRMDATLEWLRLIPDDKFVIRRIVASRMLVSPTTGRNLYPWRRLATLLGADHKAIQRWHAQGIDMLVAALNRRKV